MFKNGFLFKLLSISAFVTLMLSACNKQEELSSEEISDQAIYAMQSHSATGKFGCYELVFPLTIVLPDGESEVTVQSYEDIKEALKTYFENNGSEGRRKHGRPGAHKPPIEFVYPISVISESGETIVVESKEALMELRADCPCDHPGGRPGHHGKRFGFSCFELVFPVTLNLPDSTTQEFQSKEELKAFLIEWRKNHQGTAGSHPTLAFPLTIKFKEDGTEQTLQNKEELIAAKKSCRE